MIRLRHRLSAFAAVAAVSFHASATPTFPGVLEDALTLSATPSCAVCHQGATSRGTVTTSLGKALTSRGMVAGDEASLRTAIAALLAARNPDILALKGGAPVEAPGYGCQCAVTGAASRVSGFASMLALGTGALLVGVRRRRR
jgi:hypothetical protein